jgi:hypothetical protein
MTNSSPEKNEEDKNKLLSKREKTQLKEIVKDNEQIVKETAIN